MPRYPGVTSALGCIVADMRHDRVKTVNQLVSDVDAVGLLEELQTVERELRALLDKSGVAFSGIDAIFELDMLYVGQTHTITATLNVENGQLDREMISAAFDAAYNRNYGRLLDGIPSRIMNYRVAVIGRRPTFDMRSLGPADAKSAADCVIDHRNIYCNGAWHSSPVYDRLSLAQGERVSGPCLLEQPDTTIFIDPDLEGRVDDVWNLVIERPAQRAT